VWQTNFCGFFFFGLKKTGLKKKLNFFWGKNSPHFRKPQNDGWGGGGEKRKKKERKRKTQHVQ
jgi:hypothetical protein